MFLAEERITDHPHIDIHKLFGNILLRPGPGHLEINFARVLFQYLWIPIVGDVARALGFRTPRAQDVFRTGVDHHRSRQALSVLLDALSEELLVPYVRHCLKHKIPPSALNYFTWLQSVQNGSYIYMFHMTFTHLLAFKLFNAGVRKNYSQVMMVARAALVPLFYGKHPPMYHVLLLRDMCMRVNSPDDVRQHIEATESFTLSGNELTGQGADFIQEQSNKEVKCFLPRGFLGAKIWRTINNITDTDANDEEVSSRRRYIKHDLEITMVRRMVRKSGMFNNPATESHPISVSGLPLDPMVVTIKEQTTSNYRQFKDDVVKEGSFTNQKVPLVCVMQEERDKMSDIKSKTKVQISADIDLLIETMPDRDVALTFHENLTKIKDKIGRSNKDSFINLYYEVLQCLEQQLALAVVAAGEEDEQLVLEENNKRTIVYV